MGHYRSRVMQQGECNAPATMVRAMNEIFRDMIFKDLIIYIDDIRSEERRVGKECEP